MKPISTLIALLKSKSEPRLGTSASGRGLVHALVAVYKGGKSVTLSEGAGMPLPVRLFAPPAVYTDLGNVPVFFTEADIGEESPEAWIDRNEKKLFPFGVPPVRVVHDYFAEAGKLYSAAAVMAEGSRAAGPLPGGPPACVLGAPLWSLAKLYSKEITGPFIVWRVSAGGSALGYVDGGALRRLVHCYVDCDDCSRSAAESAAAIERVARSFSAGDTNVPVVLFSPEPSFSLPPDFVPGGYAVRRAPRIPGVRDWCHEAYANALFGNAGHNFLPFDEARKARRANARYDSLRSGARIAAALAVGLLLVSGAADGVLYAFGRHYREPMVKVKTEGDAILAAEKRRDMLLRKVREKMKLATRRSHCTELLSDLQVAFPEGVWAEDISITEVDTATWHCDIQALTRSSGLISAALEGIGKAAGASNARMIYSEHVVLPDKTGAIRFKVKCEWR